MDYTDLLAWTHAMDLCDEIYRITEQFPKREMFGLTAQMRKCAVSVPSNVAEGEGRLTRGEKRQFLSQARGSLYELETQLRIAKRAGYATPHEVFGRVAETKRILDGYIEYVRRRAKG